MQISFPGLAYEPIDVLPSRLLGIYGPASFRNRGPIEEQLAVSLAHPLGSEPLGARLRSGAHVLVIVGDGTSADPTSRLLPVLLDAIQRSGVAQRHVDILVSTASRRAMTTDELRQKLGSSIVEQYPVSQHNWRDWSQSRSLGHTSEGYPIVVNRKVAEADFVIALRDVVPDRVGGYTGGYEMIAPGCLGDTHSTLDVRWLAARYPADAILGVASNPVRQIMGDIGKIAGLDFVVQVVLDGRGEVVDIVSGNPDAAYQASATTAFQIYGVDVPTRADVVIADARPNDRDLLEAAKGLYAASLAVRSGGVIVLIAECPEGVAPGNPQVLQQCVKSVGEIDRDLSLGKLTDVVSGAFLAMVSGAIAPLGACYLISSHVSEHKSSCLGFRLLPSPKSALEDAQRLVGPMATVLVLRQATSVVPRL